MIFEDKIEIIALSFQKEKKKQKGKTFHFPS